MNILIRRKTSINESIFTVVTKNIIAEQDARDLFKMLNYFMLLLLRKSIDFISLDFTTAVPLSCTFSTSFIGWFLWLTSYYQAHIRFQHGHLRCIA